MAKTSHAPTTKQAQAKPVLPPARRPSAWIIIVVALAVTAGCYWPSLTNGLVNWDDDPNILENKNLELVGKIKQPSEVFGDIFSTEKGTVIGNYNPLPIYTFALEKAATGGDFSEKFIRRVHIDNLLLHLTVVVFTMIVLLQLGIGPWGALLGGLLMGIHPMRVESVAWATERKDVLFGAFFFAALSAYIQYIKTPNRTLKPIFFILSMALAVLSLCSKVQAVTLVVSLALTDYYLRRPMHWRLIAEKIPLFIASVAMGLINLSSLAKEGSTDDTVTGYNFLDRIGIASWSFTTYLYKLLIPHPLSPLYPFPKVIPWYEFASLAVVLVAGYAVWRAWKADHRAWVFGGLFFFLNVAPVLQLFGAGQGYLADRFTYVPYFGWFFLAALLYERQRKSGKNIVVLTGGLAVLLMVFGLMTYRQTRIWKNGETLWTHVMETEFNESSKQYTTSLPFRNRGQYRHQKGNFEGALNDYNRAIALDPNHPDAFISRGKTWFELVVGGKAPIGKEQEYLEKALKDYTSALTLPKIPVKKKSEALINRGAAYASLQQYDLGLKDINEGLQLVPSAKNGYHNRSVIHFRQKKYEDALADYSMYLQLDPDNANMLYERGMLCRAMNRPDEALADLSRALTINPSLALAWLERGRAYKIKGNMTAAQADFQKAVQMGLKLEPFDIIQQQ